MDSDHRGIVHRIRRHPLLLHFAQRPPLLQVLDTSGKGLCAGKNAGRYACEGCKHYVSLTYTCGSCFTILTQYAGTVLTGAKSSEEC